ncbi:MAG: response regulator [Leeuwenhoekiella sp.]|jgi:CheY-like chemotaxis protein|nr:response regulator [Leeuwenhoekiella blandensis]MBQ51556.1 response regulator [Leeuwenhoekiella sp.]|tara:strand:- start:1560 stop:2156 length:597 start_codon:yes stop_codon:yes gene_type:complete
MIKEELKILMVEDNPADVTLIRREISKVAENAEVTVCNNVTDFRLNLIKNPPDLIISDYNLPTSSGLEILEVAQRLTPSVTFLFITGTINDEELAADTILNGASGYMLKKNISKLHQRLEPYLNAISKNGPMMHPVRKKIVESKKLVRDIEVFLENFSRENMSHREGMLKIQEDLKRLKSGYDFKTLKEADRDPTQED